jgi:hypothetical protein
MDVEVGHSIAKFLTKLERLSASFYTIINVGNISMTEVMAIMIAKRLPQVKGLHISKPVLYSVDDGAINQFK